MNTWKTITATALGGALLLSVAPAAAAVTRPRPTDVPGAQSAIAPDGFQVYNDYASPERTYSSERIVVHYVVLGIDAPPLNDDDADGIPDYVEHVGAAADRALAYYERRGFRAPLADEGGPDARPDVYVSRFSPGTLGVAFPAADSSGRRVRGRGEQPRPERRSGASRASTRPSRTSSSTSSSSRTSARRRSRRSRPGSSRGRPLRSRRASNPRLDDLVSTIQLRRWFSATEQSITAQSYGAQLLWRRLDAEQPRLLPALFRRLAARPSRRTRDAAPSPRRTPGSRGSRSRRRSTGSPSRSPPTTATRSSPCSACAAARHAARSSRRSPCTTSVWCCRAAALTHSPSPSRADVARRPRP